MLDPEKQLIEILQLRVLFYTHEKLPPEQSPNGSSNFYVILAENTNTNNDLWKEIEAKGWKHRVPGAPVLSGYLTYVKNTYLLTMSLKSEFGRTKKSLTKKALGEVHKIAETLGITMVQIK